MDEFGTTKTMQGIFAGGGLGPSSAPSASTAPDTQAAPAQPAPAPFGGNPGNPLGSFAPKMPKVPEPSFGGVLADQYRSILGMAYETVRRRMRLGPGGEQKRNNPFADAGSVFGQLMGGAWNGAQTQPQPAQPAAPQPQPAQTMQNLGAETPKEQTPAPSAAQNAPQPRPQIVETRGLFGGRTRSYERNGVTVEIPKSVGADEESVNRYMDQTNEMVDMMESAYADED